MAGMGGSRSAARGAGSGLAAAALLTACLAGCMMEGGRGPMSDAEKAEMLYQKIQVTVFDPICALCHSGETPAQGLDLTAAHARSVIGKPSSEIAGLLLVKPGDPDSSYMIWKLENRPGIDGLSMPWGMAPLPDDQIRMIREWIRLLGRS